LSPAIASITGVISSEPSEDEKEESGGETEESGGETEDSELSQSILPQWPIESNYDQTDDDPLPLPPFKKRKQTCMDDVTINNEEATITTTFQSMSERDDTSIYSR